MQAASRPSGPPQDHPIWARIADYEIGPTDASLSFAARLARENGWIAPFADRVLEEYRRFCFLAATGAEPVTPSDAVDQAWHLHLTYSRDYWDRFCPQVLGRPLHHDPTAGGPVERGRFFAQYARTLHRYEAMFGHPPPADIWPSAARRLLHDPKARRVHPADAFILPRRKTLLAAVLLFLLLLIPLIGKAASYAFWSL